MKPTSPLTHMCPCFPFLLKFTLLFPLVISAKVEDSHIICTSKKWHWFLPCPTKLVVSVGGSNLAFSVLPGMGRWVMFEFYSYTYSKVSMLLCMNSWTKGLLGLLPKFWHDKKFWPLFSWIPKFTHLSHLPYLDKFFAQHLASQNFGMPSNPSRP